MKLTRIVSPLLCASRVTARSSALPWCARLLLALLLLLTLDLRAANIAWVSDTPNSNGTAIVAWTSPAVTGTNVDDSFITLLQNAGNNVVRFTADDNGATLLSAGDITALNTNDVIIIGRATGSGAFGGNQGTQWNTTITKPLIVTSPYLTRSTQLGFFSGTTIPDTTMPLIPLTATAANAKAAYLLGLYGPGVIGSTTAGVYDEALSRNTSQTQDNPVTGGVVLATGNGTNKVIVELPVGTAVRGGTLAGYRLYFSAGNRESGTAPTNNINFAGAETLTSIGEAIFLRAVDLAANNGVVPNLGQPPVVTTNPTDASVCTGVPLILTSAATGENPLYYQWFLDNVAIPAGTNAIYSVPSFQVANAGNYYVVVSN
ncbi:MAG TPA: immunoglobulin domain-containing protein, partial [Candidatus Acidoferrum sp.]|nr:immunoglobulin domain-containing protein [Candidatus Acidoferrum sp.]